MATGNAEFDFSSDEAGVTYECALDGGAYTPCTDPQAYLGMMDGAHTLDVRAVDEAGNRDPTPAHHEWTIDTTPPDTTIVTGPDPVSGFATADFDFDSTEPGVTYECRLDGGAWAPCTDPAAFAGLAEGGHTLDVRGTDPAGNVDPTPAHHAWTIDTTVLDTQIDSGPAALSTSADATFDFSANKGGVTYECSLDGAAYAACTDPVTFTGLPDGAHDLKVRANDGLGNVDVTPAEHAWTIDTGAPETSIAAGPATVTNVKDAPFDFESDTPGVTYE
jgi:hypothetical protein